LAPRPGEPRKSKIFEEVRNSYLQELPTRYLQARNYSSLLQEERSETQRPQTEVIKTRMLSGMRLTTSKASPCLWTSARRCYSASTGIARVGVVGLGLMGHGIAQIAAEKGYEVTAVEIEERFLTSGLARVEDSVKKCVHA
jgi:phosphoglycerate dehydrogenase-like enzyme